MKFQFFIYDLHIYSNNATVIKRLLPTTSEPDTQLCDQQQRISYKNSRRKCEKQSHERKGFLNKLIQLATSKATITTYISGLAKPPLHCGWAVVYKATDLSFIDSRIPLHGFLFLKSVRKEIAEWYLSVTTYLTFSFFLMWTRNHLSILYLSPSVFLQDPATPHNQMNWTDF